MESLLKYLLIPGIDKIKADMCGMAILPPGWSHQRRMLDTMVLIIGDRGSLVLKEDDTDLVIEPSSIILLRADQFHEGIRPTVEKTRYFWLHFSVPAKTSVISEKEALQIVKSPEIAKSRLSRGLLLPNSIKIELCQKLKDQFQEMLNEYQNRSFTELKYQMMAQLLLINLNELVFKTLSQNSRSLRSGLVNIMIQSIYENLADPDFSVKSLAYDLGYNSEYLNRHFKGIMSITLKSYIIDKRIELARRYLCETSMSLSEISDKTGFSSYRNFVRQFKLRTDQLPSEYRSRFLLMHINH